MSVSNFSDTLQLFVTLSVKPSELDGYLGAMQREAAGARSEAGCLAFDLLIDPAAPHTLYLLEHWASQAALEVDHAKQAYDIHVRGLEAQALTGEFEERYLRPIAPIQPYPAGVKSRAAAGWTQVLILQGGDNAQLAALDAAFAAAAPTLRAAAGHHATLLFANDGRAGERLLVQSWDHEAACHAAWTAAPAQAFQALIDASHWRTRQRLHLHDRASR